MSSLRPAAEVARDLGACHSEDTAIIEADRREVRAAVLEEAAALVQAEGRSIAEYRDDKGRLIDSNLLTGSSLVRAAKNIRALAAKEPAKALTGITAVFVEAGWVGSDPARLTFEVSAADAKPLVARHHGDEVMLTITAKEPP